MRCPCVAVILSSLFRTFTRWSLLRASDTDSDTKYELSTESVNPFIVHFLSLSRLNSSIWNSSITADVRHCGKSKLPISDNFYKAQRASSQATRVQAARASPRLYIYNIWLHGAILIFHYYYYYYYYYYKLLRNTDILFCTQLRYNVGPGDRGRHVPPPFLHFLVTLSPDSLTNRLCSH